MAQGMEMLARNVAVKGMGKKRDIKALGHFVLEDERLGYLEMLTNAADRDGKKVLAREVCSESWEGW